MWCSNEAKFKLHNLGKSGRSLSRIRIILNMTLGGEYEKSRKLVTLPFTILTDIQHIALRVGKKNAADFDFKGSFTKVAINPRYGMTVKCLLCR